MQKHEYLAIPAPVHAQKVKGIKDPAERHAHTVSALMNEMAAQGWEYLRADVLPCVARRGLTGTVTVYNTLLVFRRLTAAAREQAMGARPDGAVGVDQAAARAGASISTAEAAAHAVAPLSTRISEGAAPPLVLRRDSDLPVTAPHFPAGPLNR